MISITEKYFTTIDSTQTFAKSYIDETKEIDNWLLIRADSQTHGKGQGDKGWSSPKRNLYHTYIIPMKQEEGFKVLPYASILATVSTCQVIESIGLKTEIKWVNDVRIKGKKVSGCLCESVIQDDKVILLIGIGINVGMTKEELISIDQPSTALNLELGNDVMLDELKELLNQKLYNNVYTLINEGKDEFMKYYDDHLVFKNSSVVVTSKDGKDVKGIFKGIDGNGFAILETDEGNITVMDGRMYEN
jgi:BirA family biotin operon repressor/biotin-[acetyl-CoA-carboxylase] ligase